MKYYWYKETKTKKSTDRILIAELDLPQGYVKEMIDIADTKTAMSKSGMIIFKHTRNLTAIELGYTAVDRVTTCMLLSRDFLPCFVDTYHVIDENITTGIKAYFQCASRQKGYELIAWYRRQLGKDDSVKFLNNKPTAFRYVDTHNNQDHGVYMEHAKDMAFVYTAKELGLFKKNCKIKSYKNGNKIQKAE